MIKSSLKLKRALKPYFLAPLFCFVLCFICAAPCSAQNEVHDPLEDVNRSIFWFNDQIDVYVMEPVASVYDYIFPSLIKNCVRNFFKNLEYPVFLLSDLAQFKFVQAKDHTSRFLINTTMGFGGLFDMAKTVGLEHHEEDFGTALAFHGVGDGPYIVIPLLGPSNLRDALSRIVDRGVTPTTYFSNIFPIHKETEDVIEYSLLATEVISTRARLLSAVESAKEASLDYYLFTRSAYKQNRDGVIYDGIPPDDMDFEDDEEFEDEE